MRIGALSNASILRRRRLFPVRGARNPRRQGALVARFCMLASRHARPLLRGDVSRSRVVAHGASESDDPHRLRPVLASTARPRKIRAAGSGACARVYGREFWPLTCHIQYRYMPSFKIVETYITMGLFNIFHRISISWGLAHIDCPENSPGPRTIHPCNSWL